MRLTLEETVTDLYERQAIIDLLHDYCYFTDTQNIEALVTRVFAPDGSDDHGGGPVVGASALSDWFRATFANIESASHNLSNIVVNRDGDRAQVRSSVVTWSWTKASADQGPLRPADYVLCAYYLDEVEKRDGEWRIVRRKLATNGASVVGQGTIPPTQTGMHALASNLADRAVVS